MTNNRLILQQPNFSEGSSGYATFEGLLEVLQKGKWKCPCLTGHKYIFIRKNGLHYAMCECCGRVLVAERDF